MKYHVLTLYPELIQSFAEAGIIGRAVHTGLLSINAVNIRDYSTDNYHSVDDYPYGGGAGMVMMPGPVVDCVRDVRQDRNIPVVFFTPRGKRFDAKSARLWSQAEEQEIILLCGHFEGIDERAIQLCVTDEISMGDYILTGGHIAAMCFMDAVSRHIPGVLGNSASMREESFESGLLEYEQYTRPAEFEGIRVPDVLLSGNHRLLREYHKSRSLALTRKHRPDLIEEDSTGNCSGNRNEQ